MEKMKFKIFTLFVSLALVISIFPKPEIRAESQTGTCGANITWELDDNMTLTLSGSGVTKDYWDESNQSPFYSIADRIKKVVIKDGITGLGDYLFYNCSSISAVELPNSLATIGRGVFSCCSSLKSISLPNNLSKLGLSVFYKSGLEELVIPEGIPYVPGFLCQSCGSLKKVTLPQSCTAIREYAFSKCEKLESIEIPANVEQISFFAFQYCTGLKSITIPEKVTSLGDHCFYNCNNLESVFIMGSVQEGRGVFWGCSYYLVEHYAYDVSYTNDGHGTISGKNRSIGTDVIELTVVPKNEFCTLDKVTLTNADNTLNSEIQVSLDANNKARLTMPDSTSTVTIHATFKVPEKTVTFKDDAGCVYKTIQVAYGDIPVYGEDVPTKKETDAYTYTFIGWMDGTYFFSVSDPLPAVTEDVTYTAVYTATMREYEITFVDEDGNELQSEKLKYGRSPYFYGTKPTKEETDEFTYSFAGWNDGKHTYYVYDPFPVVVGDTTYTAVFTATKREYEISFVGEEGNELQSGKIEYGEIPIYTGTEQTKEETDEYIYSFVGWTDGTNTYSAYDPLPAVTGDAIYTVVFALEKREYEISFVDEEGNELQSGKIMYGEIPTYTGTEPTKEETDEFTYSFAGWTDGTTTYGISDPLPEVTGDASYTVVFAATKRDYEISFVDEDGNELQSGKIEYGEIPTYTDTEPTKEETDKFTYSFAGWSDGTTTYGVSDPLPAVTGDATYTAVFTKTEKPTEPSETAQIIAPTKPTEPSKPTDPSEPSKPTEPTDPAEPAEPTILVEPAEPTEKVPGEYYLVSITGEGENSDIVIIVKRTEDDAHCIDYLDKIEADGKVLTIGQHCTVKSGSTIITLKKAYLETLTEGSHTLKVFFNDGGSISVNFMVKFLKAQAQPKTGETASMASMVGAGLFLVACAAAGAVVIRRRKEEN
ncbi:MAG: leucine-rich repeat protein [Clostridiales bacterium]|nr:leucine-rich repeat protein [Clostridiales bacterium]